MHCPRLRYNSGIKLNLGRPKSINKRPTYVSAPTLLTASLNMASHFSSSMKSTFADGFRQGSSAMGSLSKPRLPATSAASANGPRLQPQTSQQVPEWFKRASVPPSASRTAGAGPSRPSASASTGTGATGTRMSQEQIGSWEQTVRSMNHT